MTSLPERLRGPGFFLSSTVFSRLFNPPDHNVLLSVYDTFFGFQGESHLQTPGRRMVEVFQGFQVATRWSEGPIDAFASLAAALSALWCRCDEAGCEREVTGGVGED